MRPSSTVTLTSAQVPKADAAQLTSHPSTSMALSKGMRRKSCEGGSPVASCAQSSLRATSPRQLMHPLPATASEIKTCPSAQTTRTSSLCVSHTISSCKRRGSPTPEKSSHASLEAYNFSAGISAMRLPFSIKRMPNRRIRARSLHLMESLRGARTRALQGSGRISASQTKPSPSTASDGRSTGMAMRYSDVCEVE